MHITAVNTLEIRFFEVPDQLFENLSVNGRIIHLTQRVLILFLCRVYVVIQTGHFIGGLASKAFAQMQKWTAGDSPRRGLPDTRSFAVTAHTDFPPSDYS